MHLVDEGASPTTLNATISGLKFVFDGTLDRRVLLGRQVLDRSQAAPSASAPGLTMMSTASCRHDSQRCDAVHLDAYL